MIAVGPTTKTTPVMVFLFMMFVVKATHLLTNECFEALKEEDGCSLGASGVTGKFVIMFGSMFIIAGWCGSFGSIANMLVSPFCEQGAISFTLAKRVASCSEP